MAQAKPPLNFVFFVFRGDPSEWFPLSVERETKWGIRYPHASFERQSEDRSLLSRLKIFKRQIGPGSQLLDRKAYNLWITRRFQPAIPLRDGPK